MSEFFTVGKMFYSYSRDTELHRSTCSEREGALELRDLDYPFVEYADLDALWADWADQDEWSACVELCEQCRPLD